MQIDFLTTADGVRIASSRHGAGPLLVYVRGWSSHIEHLWNDPMYRAYFEALGEQFTVVRFDMRGNGLSDRRMPQLDLKAMVADIEAVMNSLGGQSVVLYGQCFGGPATIAYAAAHPERVEKLILDGTYADGRRVASPEQRKRILTTLRDMPQAGMAFMTHMTHPNPPATRLRNAQLRGEYFYENALELYTFGYDVDVTALLPRITVPTLVIHRSDTRAIPCRLGRDLAAAIEGARFVALEGQAHNAWDEHPRDALDAIGEFLDVDFTYADVEQPPETGPARTMLFTELADPPQSAGDTDPQSLIHQHRSIVRGLFDIHGGDEIERAGAGVLASFEAPTAAIECAIAVQRAIADRPKDSQPMNIRIGVSMDVPASDGPVQPDATTVSAKGACAAGDPGDITVTGIVRELCAGKGYLFADRGFADLNESEQSVRLYNVRWRHEP